MRGFPEPCIAWSAVGFPEIDYKIASVARFERTVDDCLDIGEVVAGQPGDKINREIGMPKTGAGLPEERVVNSRGQPMRVAAHVAIEQRELGIHRGGFGEHRAAVPLDAQWNAGSRHDIENLLFKLLTAQKS